MKHKIGVCFLTGLNACYGLHEVARLPFREQQDILGIICLVVFIASMGFVPIWHWKEKRGMDSATVLGFFQSGLCYFIALDLCMFAWRKIFHLQFYAPDGLLDKTISSLSGEMFTIAYFSYSYTFGLIIAAMQIVGSLLLLFRKARLLGIFVLFPVVSNIILIDVFYEVETGALIQAMVILAGLVYLMGIERKKIAAFFLDKITAFRKSAFESKMMKNTIRISAIFLPMSACIYLYDYPNRHPEITGKYEVKELLVNRRPIDLTNCADSMITKVYIDNNHDLVFERNSLNRWQVGRFTYDKTKRKMKVVWRYPQTLHDTLDASLSEKSNQQMTLSGIMGRDTIKALLVQK
ncbi:hypothetical protein [Flavobacterium sp.]|uniref:hypothetical protein n=1 Tax=Flavobacterium sp. TaxID=239 RepID=UPI0039E3256D